ncbi:galactose-inhibitable lectin 35 kDa subunit precursor, putative [Entamoeba invadens IP1]|uniref:Galactose-inhibitable lectin 35 kDa subunit, putative n=1 Tax=Entamoeba invadens IP1 TaxID=370355 RepID=A0A0A1U935_ENTIV|nr:galactose-inhibitable lectin 35 kDa subunit precursor, putative [Entamoeba invadens IP1]ELP91357.1 galactose-inhibitable lectin 35 kDa subunit precursor, putative [Entamoeba invadens IP1]|eukprot:XP_004258128.1 galactose-inhibitable lectin 35 kDa subunit precursor, putative [Entamoeba invadens IP1]
MYGVPPEKGSTIATNELYDRTKCTTCCRIIIASGYNYDYNRGFTEDDYVKGKGRIFTFDFEFDNVNELRSSWNPYEQAIMLRPLNTTRDFQFFEFSAYKMFTSFVYPRRVFDVRNFVVKGHVLIIWRKNPPLSDAPGTNNQRFVYAFPYENSYYIAAFEKRWVPYPRHFFLPYYLTSPYCYEGSQRGEFFDWPAESQMRNVPDCFQIKAWPCSATEPRQIFIPIYA